MPFPFWLCALLIAPSLSAELEFPLSLSLESGQANIVASQKDGKYTITLPVNQSFTLSIPGNRTTGYSWILANLTALAPEITLIAANYIPDPSPPHMMGVDGKEIFTFKALKKGQKTIKLEYRQPWDKTKAEAEKTVNIKVIIQ